MRQLALYEHLKGVEAKVRSSQTADQVLLLAALCQKRMLNESPSRQLHLADYYSSGWK